MSDPRTSTSADPATRLLVGTLVALTGFLLWRGNPPRATFAADGTGSTWDSAVEESQDARRPAVVLFTAGWCPACQALHHDVLARPDVAGDLRDRHTYVVVDLTCPTPADRARATHFGVRAIPTLIRFDAAGHESARTHGMDADDLRRWLAADESVPTE